MLLPYDKAAYRSVNSGTATTVSAHSVPWSHTLVTLVSPCPKYELLQDNILFGIFFLVFG